MITVVMVCDGCAPPGVEQLSKYFCVAECQACGASAQMFGYRLSALLEAVKASAPAHAVDRMLDRVLPAVRFDEEKPPASRHDPEPD